MRPTNGDSVHYVEHRGRGCAVAIIRDASHPEAGDDGSWCVTLDMVGFGYHHHVPHGFNPDHWHHRNECKEK